MKKRGQQKRKKEKHDNLGDNKWTSRKGKPIQAK